MKRHWFSMCAVLGFVFVSAGFAIDPILIGNFEDGSVTVGPGDIRWDNWMVNSDSSAVTVPVIAATLGTHSLKWVDADGGDWLGSDIQLPYGNALDERLEAWLNPPAVIMVDVTAFPSEVAGGWARLNLFHNAAGGWGFEDDTGQDVIIDGTPHTYIFKVTEHFREVILASIDGWGCNLGFGLRSANDTSTTIYLDNIWICPEGPVDAHGPYGRWEEQSFSVNPEFVDLVLHWKAGADPNDEYEVNPLIVDQYVFMGGVSGSDPNLYYLGNTDEDPGLTDPNSRYPQTGSLLLPINSTYRWAVVEALEGFEQTFTVGVSTLENVDPNNIKGPIWSFNTLSTTPVITAQPVSTRFAMGGPNPTFTIAVDSVAPESYQWYFSQDAVIDPENDVAISPSIGGDTDTLTIPSSSAAYQAYYYCKVWNAATVSGGGTEEDIYSDVVTLVVERKVAEYLFDGNLDDTSASGIHGSGVGSPGFEMGVDGGSALSLNGIDQYVDLGVGGYPKAGLLDAGGIGGGLDEGSVVCWVKVNSIPTVEDTSRIAAILSSINEGWPSTQFELGLESDGAVTYTNTRTFIIGDTAQSAWVSWRPTWVENFNLVGDGQWHQLAVVWPVAAGQTQQIHVYVDGSLIATGDITSTTFSPWQSSMLIGAANPGGSGVTRFFDGLIDNLRVYNYTLSPEEIAQEYYDITGNSGCIYMNFEGSNLNVDNTGTSYCRVDLADLAGFAAGWLSDGFYP